MASTLAEDVNVDELRRRARRRLVGAIVLALAAAVIVPMLLESEPRPLGEDVAVKIPPVDDGKFVNRLNDPAAKADKSGPGARAPKASDAKGGDAARTAEAPRVAEAAKSTEAPRAADVARSSEAAKGGDPARPSETAKAETVDAARSSETARASDAAKGKYDTRLPAKEAAPAPPTTAAAAAPATSAAAPGASTAAPASGNGAFAVQLAAFSDDKGANALASRLKRAGYAAYTEPVKTSKATLWRVRVGPYPSREAATAARDKLKAEGQNGIVAPAH